MQIIAHRGASGLAPENSLKAIALAEKMGAPAIEIDVQLADGELWLFHDRRLERCSNGRGRFIEQSAEALRSYRLAEGEIIPTLWQVLELIDGRAELHIELKSQGCAEPLAALLAHAETELNWHSAQWLLSSFDHRELLAAKALLPQLRIAPLIAGVPKQLAHFAQEMGAWSLNCDIDFVTPELVEDAHQRDLKLLVYTVDHLDDAQLLAAWGVDGIFTNQPQQLLPHFGG